MLNKNQIKDFMTAMRENGDSSPMDVSLENMTIFADTQGVELDDVIEFCQIAKEMDFSLDESNDSSEEDFSSETESETKEVNKNGKEETETTEKTVENADDKEFAEGSGKKSDNLTLKELLEWFNKDDGDSEAKIDCMYELLQKLSKKYPNKKLSEFSADENLKTSEPAQMSDDEKKSAKEQLTNLKDKIAKADFADANSVKEFIECCGQVVELGKKFGKPEEFAKTVFDKPAEDPKAAEDKKPEAPKTTPAPTTEPGKEPKAGTTPEGKPANFSGEDKPQKGKFDYFNLYIKK